MKKNVLVIMAAGIGSRFGGIKQLTPVGPGGVIFMEYSIYDAIRAGFILKKILKQLLETVFQNILKQNMSYKILIISLKVFKNQRAGQNHGGLDKQF